MHGASHEVLGRLAVGGMAELYLARTTHANGRREVVVLKRILPHLSEDPEFVRMFRDEAFLAATLDHPNIVHVHDIGQDGEDYFFTMEYVHGENVRTIIKAAQKLEVDIPLQHVIQIALGVCEGLHYAHEQVDEDGTPLRIVHRDVSPTNILVAFDGDVKIVDFGIAKAAAATHVTQAGMLKGKASYMSPEQCRAEQVDRRSDVFAIGILIYEMTTLTRLFRGDNELAVLHQILTGTVEPPSTRVDEYPPDLERIVMRALAQRPADRYPTALALHEDLEQLARSRGFFPSRDALGEFVRELCGERPLPWDDEEELEDEESPLAADEEGTGMPTSMGNFEDEEDTQVNRRTPELRTLVPGAPNDWEPDAAAPEETTGTTNRRMVPQGPAVSAPPRTGAKRVGGGESAPALPGRPGAGAGVGRDAAGRLRIPGKSMPRRAPSAEATVPAPGADDEALAVSNGLVQAETTMPMSKQGVAKAMVPRGPLARGSGVRPASGDPDPGAPFRSGRTLAGAGGGLAGPLPARSGRTLPGDGQTPSTSAGSGDGSGQPMVVPAGQSPLPGGADRTMTAGAGSRPRAVTGQARPGRRPTGEAATPAVGFVSTLPGPASQPEPETEPVQIQQAQPLHPQLQPMQPGQGQPQPGQPQMQPGPMQLQAQPQPPATADRTMALTPEQARAMAELGMAASPPAPHPASAPMPSAWSGPGVDRTELATPGQRREVDEAARTLAMQRFDRAALAEAAVGRELPRGPMGWDGQDPLTRTQRTSAADPVSLTSTQKSPIHSLDGPPSAPYPPMPVHASTNVAADLVDLRRPEMRSPAPRPPATPRSLWVPVLIVLIVGLAATAVWLWYSSGR
jgi:serine/threonine protein kinase